MANYSLLIDYHYCTGCHSCEVACQHEHNYAAGTNGIMLREYEYQAGGKVQIDYLPFFTRHCDLCKDRRSRGEQPSCVKHCQAACMEFGLTQALAAKMENRNTMVLFTHNPGR